jgi:signal transduction histidine kinase
MPLISPDGYKLGTLCVIDTRPRELTLQQNAALEILSRQVMSLLELRRKNKQLRRLHEMHNRLLTIIGHDLRGPVNSINGLLLLSEKYDLKLEEYKELIPRMRSMVDTTNNLLLNLLHWAKSQLDAEANEKERLIISSVVQRITSDNMQIFSSKGNSVINNVDPRHVVLADQNMIDFIIRNLMLNANKFMDNGTITITSVLKHDMLEITVADTGSGMPDNIDVFMWGHRNSADGTKGEKGSGFGLPMSKEFIDLHKGKISYVSSASGTSFTFTLPADVATK